MLVGSVCYSLCYIQVPGNENPSILISFASKTLNAGQVTSKMHIIELGAQPGPVSSPLTSRTSMLMRNMLMSLLLLQVVAYHMHAFHAV